MTETSRITILKGGGKQHETVELQSFTCLKCTHWWSWSKFAEEPHYCPWCGVKFHESDIEAGRDC